MLRKFSGTNMMFAAVLFAQLLFLPFPCPILLCLTCLEQKIHTAGLSPVPDVCLGQAGWILVAQWPHALFFVS